MSGAHPNPAELTELEQKWIGNTVRVADGIPSLSRFAGRDGLVRAVNRNGRCLVTFEASPDAGWYDIDPVNLSTSPS